MFSKQWFSALLLIGIAFSSARAQPQGQDKGNATPPSAPPDFSKEAYIIEHVTTRIAAEGDGSEMREVSAEVKMLADAGVKKFAVLDFTYTSANEVVEIDYVRVRKPDGTVVKTPDYNIQDMPGEVTRTAPMYSDIHEKHVAVKGLGAGDVLEYRARYRVVKPQVPGQFWQEYSFTKDAIARDEQLEISFPAGKYVKVVSPDFRPEIKEENGRKIYHWSHSNLVVKEKQPGEIPRRIPPNPDVQVTTFASWEDIGRWYGELQKEPLQVTASIQAKASELTKGLKTDDEKIRAIYSFVALKFHYIGLDFGIGRYQPHAADDVLENGYGDCKDKHTLLASLLRAAGVEAWPALIHSSRKLDPEVPSPAQFNHVITVVPQGDKLVWLDTTPEVSPYGFLLVLLRGKQALMIPVGKAPALVMTPENPPFPQKQFFSMEGKLNGEGTFSGHAEQSYRGDTEVALRAAFRQVPESQWKEALQRFSYALNFGGEVSNVNLTRPDDLSKSFDVSYDYERKNYGGWESRQITPPFPPMGIEMSKESKKPLEPVVLGALGEITYRGKVTLPAGYSATAPANVDLVRDYAEYHSAYSIENGVFSASRRLVIKKNEVALSSWEDYRDFGKAVSDDENNYVHLSGGDGGSVSGSAAKNPDLDRIFQEGVDALQNRDFTRAEELFKRVMAGDPKYHGAHFNLAAALVSQGKMAEGISEFRKEEEVTPSDQRSYQMAATYSMFANHNEDAIQDWSKLLKIDPKNRDAALKLSGLLTAGGKNAEAVAVLEEAVKQSPGSPSLEMALGQAYVKAGYADKAIPYMRQAVKDETDPHGLDPGMLNDAAYLLAESNQHLDEARQFAEKAVVQLDARSLEAAKTDDPTGLTLAAGFAATWDTLGWVYFQQGDLTRAEDYVRAAWVLGQSGTSGDHLAQIYEKLGRKKEAEHVYLQALSAHYVPTISWGDPSSNRTLAYATNRNIILSHYQKLTGRKEPPPLEIRRLPSGEWSKTPSDELLAKRRASVSKAPHPAAVCDFEMVFSPGQVETIRYVKGDETLRAMMEKVKAAHFEMLFPAGSTAKIPRMATLTCSPSSGCNVELLLPREAVTR